MYKLKDLVIYKKIGVCLIDKIEISNFGDGEKSYYILKPYYQTTASKIMIPTDRCLQIRPVMSKEEANELISYLATMPTIEIDDQHLKKDVFEDVYAHGDKKDLCSLLCTIYNERLACEKDKKRFSESSKKVFESCQKLIFEEIGCALGIAPDDVPNHIFPE